MTRTPEFLLWSISQKCPLRTYRNWDDPQRTERHLRAARAFAEAMVEGRVLGDLCFDNAVDPWSVAQEDEPRAFRIEASLAHLGGSIQVLSTCDECPARTLAAGSKKIAASCYGWWILPDDPSPIHQTIERAATAAKALDPNDAWPMPTSPCWYGVWQQGVFTGDHLPALTAMLEQQRFPSETAQASATHLAAAARVAFLERLPLVVTLYPPGHVENRLWTLDPHCPRCQAPSRHDPERCGVCGYIGPITPTTTFKARGSRPWRPLSQVALPEERAKVRELLAALEEDPEGNSDEESKE